MRLRDGTIIDDGPAYAEIANRIFAEREAARDPVAEAAYQATAEAARETIRAAKDQPPAELAGLDVVDLLALDLPPLRQAFAGLLPEGLGVLAAPPKSGKSLLAYQFGIELRLGQPVLGRVGEKRPVLYYALEDGRRRSQSRIRAILGDRKMTAHGFVIRWAAPRLGGPLEAEIAAWLDGNEAGVVIVDVLAKVRQDSGKTRANAYDEDYTALNAMHDVARRRPGSTILIVTHDRKAGSADWITRVTGTRGVTGVVDFAIFIDRDRGKPTATIYVTGRDIPDDAITAAFMGSHWQPASIADIIVTSSGTRQAIFTWVKDNGPAWQKSIAEGTGLSESVVYNRVRDMAKDGQLVPSPAGYIAGD